MSRRDGVTLVELLVVVTAIAALAAIVIPVYMTIRAKGNVPGCASNLAQIGKALIMYADDHSGLAPPCSTYTSTSLGVPPNLGWYHIDGRPKEWKASLSPYTRDDGVFWCPADFHRGSATFRSLWEEPWDHTSLYTSYMISNRLRGRKYARPGGILRLRLTDEPAVTTLYLYDTMWLPPSDHRTLLSCHGESSNRLYIDGHVTFRPNMAPP